MRELSPPTGHGAGDLDGQAGVSVSDALGAVAQVSADASDPRAPVTLGMALRRARLAAGMSQYDLSGASGVSQKWISGIETDYRGSRSRPRQATVRKLAEATGLPPRHHDILLLLEVSERQTAGTAEYAAIADLFATNHDFRRIVRALLRSFGVAA
jgi:transcriptional regulator with XRE-family HTH domain